MIKFFVIPKNAHTTLKAIEGPIQTWADGEVVCLRQPLERFWSACKTITPTLSPFGDFPWTDESCRNPPQNYNNTGTTPEAVIAEVKQRLIDGDLTDHLQRQVDLIGDRTFSDVIKVESLNADIESLISKYNLKNVDILNLTVSVKDWDSQAMAIINSDSYFADYYAADQAIYDDPTPLIHIPTQS